jgi:hypothetical protein
MIVDHVSFYVYFSWKSEMYIKLWICERVLRRFLLKAHILSWNFILQLLWKKESISKSKCFAYYSLLLYTESSFVQSHDLWICCSNCNQIQHLTTFFLIWVEYDIFQLCLFPIFGKLQWHCNGSTFTVSFNTLIKNLQNLYSTSDGSFWCTMT